MPEVFPGRRTDGAHRPSFILAMRFLAGLLPLAQIAFSAGASGFTPTFYDRTPALLLGWAYSDGLWVLATSTLISMVQFFVAAKRKTLTWKAGALICGIITLLWALFPYAWSLVGDLVHSRAP
jgi:hypothetical protein